MLGTQSGGYLPIHAAYLGYDEILNSERFEDSNGNRYVDTADYNGAIFNRLGTLNEYGGYDDMSTDFNLAISLGGAILDTTWLSNGPLNVPILSMHGNTDAVTPYGTAFVAPAALGGATVFLVSGGGDLIPAAVNAGRQTPLNSIPMYQGGAQSMPGQRAGSPGLYTFWGKGFQPYAWYDGSTQGAIDSAKAYLDTVIQYITPGMFEVLDLPEIVSTPEQIAQLNASIALYPNPASTEVRILSEKAQNPIISIAVVDVTGRLHQHVRNINLATHTLEVKSLSPGVYFLRIETAMGTGIKRLVIEH
jgi:hypothetical protein